MKHLRKIQIAMVFLYIIGGFMLVQWGKQIARNELTEPFLSHVTVRGETNITAKVYLDYQDGKLVSFYVNPNSIYNFYSSGTSSPNSKIMEQKEIKDGVAIFREVPVRRAD